MDNGQIWFYNVRVARDALLDRYASVAPDGTYTSPIPSVPQRFGTMVGGLTTGGPPSATFTCCSIHLCGWQTPSKAIIVLLRPYLDLMRSGPTVRQASAAVALLSC